MPIEPTASSRDEQLAALLASSPPRIVPEALLRAANRQAPSWALGVFGAAFAAFGTLFVWLFFPWNFYQDWQLAAADTARATGRIISVDRTSMSINKQRVIRYEFSFQPPGGSPVRGECFTTGVRWRSGDAATVRYRPENPARCCLDGARLSQGSAGALFVLLFPAVGGGLFVWVARARRRLRSLLERGLVAEALVTSVERTNVQINRQQQYKITLQRTDATGGPAIVLRRYQPAQVALAQERLETKQPVFVLYDPANPRRALLPEAL